MILKLFLSAALFLMSFHSEAALRCGGAHRAPSVGSPLYFAQRLDSLNEMHNNILSNRDLVSILNNDPSNLPFFQRMKARSHTKKLTKMLAELKDSKKWNNYELGVFAYKLEKLAFLSDPTVLNTMSVTDRNTYRQVQHSILVNGLKNYLFDGKQVPASLQRKVWNAVTIPFRTMYARWYFAMLVMPKLRGAVIPPDLAMNVAWHGFEANRQALKPYRAHSNFKAFFNVFSSAYRWTVLTAIFVGLPAFGFYSAAEGQAQVNRFLSPVVHEVEQMGKVNFVKWAADRELQYFVEEFKLNMGREPTAQEFDVMKVMLKAQRASQNQNQQSENQKEVSTQQDSSTVEAPRAPDLPVEADSVHWVRAESMPSEAFEAPKPVQQQTENFIHAPEVTESQQPAANSQAEAQPQAYENMNWVPADPQAQPQVHKTVADPEAKKCSIGAGSTGQQCSL
ncbi:MAG: hypothetical protein ACXWC9_07020 [Pseudobdellovibrionaceae bacterium]